VAALASYLDARAHEGRWLVRIEDTDGPRCLAGADETILHQLDRLGLRSDEAVVWQSRRSARYEAALQALEASDRAYPCACSRQDIEQALSRAGVPRARHAAAAYPGTCRLGLRGRSARAWRARVDGLWAWTDRRLGPQVQDLRHEVGDFVIARADGCWAYQLAVVVDDAEQDITHVVRGEDLADNTPRQQQLQQHLGLPTPVYLHAPLVLADDGQKLSKQNGAQAVDVNRPLTVLQAAASVLELHVLQPSTPNGPAVYGHEGGAGGLAGQGSESARVSRWLESATQAWARRWRP
jgi:glutamyl-Q tRNA(Asp) synthetase